MQIVSHLEPRDANEDAAERIEELLVGPLPHGKQRSGGRSLHPNRQICGCAKETFSCKAIHHSSPVRAEHVEFLRPFVDAQGKRRPGDVQPSDQLLVGQVQSVMVCTADNSVRIPGHSSKINVEIAAEQDLVHASVVHEREDVRDDFFHCLKFVIVAIWKMNINKTRVSVWSSEITTSMAWGQEAT